MSGVRDVVRARVRANARARARVKVGVGVRLRRAPPAEVAAEPLDPPRRLA